MKHQLIINILGNDRVGILSEIANAVSDTCCNILDSRLAIYGKEFSLTMILEGSLAAIVKAELNIPQLCQQLDLLSLMKRTTQHCKQNLEHLVDVEFSGKDTLGVIRNVTALFAEHDVAVSAFRQKTFVNQDTQADMMRCKLVASVPDSVDLNVLRQDFSNIMGKLGLTGSISEKY